MCSATDDPTTYGTEARTVTAKTWAEMRGEDIIDSRDIIERLDELNAQDARDELEEEERAILADLDEQGRSSAPDWTYGEGMIRDDYFEDYARDLAEDIGAINRDASWPNTYIDWPAAAAALQMDYSSIEIDGLTYWVR